MGGRRLPNSLSESRLKTVWKASRDSRAGSAGAPGVDGVSATDFSRRLGSSLHHTREAIRFGQFSFSPLRVCTVPKKNGTKRIIAVPTLRDRLVQRAICSHLENDKRFPKPLSVAYGFVKGRSLEDAHIRALEYRRTSAWVLQTDIISFFDRIDRADVVEVVSHSVRSKVIRDLIYKAVSTELDYSDPLTTILTKEGGLRKGRGLRQGMPLSPMLSNLLLRKFDAEIEKARLKIIRYADDIVVFCDSEVECEEALKFLEDLLSPYGLRIPKIGIDGKTTITPARMPCEVLGAEIRLVRDRYELYAPSRRLSTLNAQLMEIATAEYCGANRITLARMLAHFDSVARGHKRTVEGLHNAMDFRSRVDAIQRKAVDALLKSIIGEKAFDNLTLQKRAVLGIHPF